MSSFDSGRPENQETPVEDPSRVAGQGDPGDETQRNFRYQHSYGAILLVSAAAGARPYAAVWCEHHEDLLVERSDGSYEAYQVKTRRPELGDWVVNDEAFRRSIKRFVKLVQQFGKKILQLTFVSNTDCYNCNRDTQDRRRLQRSPHRFLEAARLAGSAGDIAEPFPEILGQLASFCDCDEETLLAVLKQVTLTKGPARDSFDAELAHSHLPLLEECRHMSPAELNAIRDEIVQRMYAASSLQVEDPLRHLPSPNGEPGPEVLAKRVRVEVVSQCIEQAGSVPFRYQSGLANLALGNRSYPHKILRAKLIRGGLGDQVETLERRTISAESRLLELAFAGPTQFDDVLNQIVNVVRGECDEAALDAQLADHPYGPRMMASVFHRLRVVAQDRPNMVHREEYECLVGVVGLLTEDCTVWWSERFDPEEAA